MKSIYEELSEERKLLQEQGLLPEWFSTSSWQLFSAKYTTKTEKDFKSVSARISKCAAKWTDDPELWEKKFFDVIWKGWLSCATPVLANMGTDRGCNVSCSGNYVNDSVYDFYEAQKEVAVLSKNGFGTSSYLGSIRPRGTEITSGGKASGVLPVLKDFVQLSRDISQGNTRRGAWAGYIEIDHEDFWEIINFLNTSPDDCNIGWIVSDKFIKRLNSGDKKAISRYQKAMKTKMVTGKGYFFFVDKVNKLTPKTYKDHGLRVKASNLCSEIALFSDKDHTFTCVLSSLNLAKYDEWKDTDTIFVSTVFLDCVASEFVSIGKQIKGLENAVRFTEKSRALGLGVMGFHTYLQTHMIPFESLDAHYKNIEIFKRIKEEAENATKWMGETFGEPEWCRGYGRRNTHLICCPPTLSTAGIMGGVSQGIEPVYKNVYVQGSAAGEMNRINPVFLELLKKKGIYDDAHINEVIDHNGSVQNVDWLTDEEKNVFKTAFEIDQKVIIRLASIRQQYIDQAQSINLFFSADESEEYISEVHQIAFNDPMIKSLYYIRSESGVQASKGECESCAG